MNCHLVLPCFTRSKGGPGGFQKRGTVYRSSFLVSIFCQESLCRVEAMHKEIQSISSSCLILKRCLLPGKTKEVQRYSNIPCMISLDFVATHLPSKPPWFLRRFGKPLCVHGVGVS